MLASYGLTARCLAADAIRSFSVPGRPFGIAVSADGATLFVSTTGSLTERSGLRVFHLSRGGIGAGLFVPLDGEAHGIAVTPDGKTVLVANGTGVAALDAKTLEGDVQSEPVYLRDAGAGSIEVLPSTDGAYAFVTEEQRGAVAVVRIDRTAGEIRLSLDTHIPLGRAPVGMALSHDGALLYVVSEIALPRTVLANGADPQVARERCAENGARNGSLSLIDTSKAQGGDTGAVVATLAAGCAPVRVELSPRGDLAWVTARGDDRLLGFDTQKIQSDPAHALVAGVPVGRAPVGLAVVDGGALVVVANSNRFAPAATSTVDVVESAKALAHSEAVRKSLPTGAFPREFAEAPDGKTLYLTNFRSDAVEVIDESALR